MTPRTPASCHHELRPGTKVCLHCRRAEREAAAARNRAVFAKLGLGAAAVGAVAFAGVSGLAAWKDSSGAGLGRLVGTPASLEAAPVAAPAPVPTVAPAATPAPAPVGATAQRVTESAESTVIAGAAGPSAVAPTSAAQPVPAGPSGAPVAAPVTAAPPAAVSSGPATLRPIVGQGRTELQNGIFALRSGDTVTVHFDTPEARTRRPEKFEQIVRATLPQVHGPAANSLLAGIAGGNLLAPGELTVDQPMRPIALRGPNGEALSLAPQTRPGRDGPLVVAYRITPSR